MKYLPNYIKSRVDRNQNFVMLFVGQTGTGKSYAAMSLAEHLDPGFNIDRIVFSAEEFVSILNNDLTLTKGSTIMWDEAGVGMPAREWYSLSNKVISYVVQTFRVKGYILIMTTPSMKYIDSQIRALFHGLAQSIDPSMCDGIFGWAKYMHLEHDPREGRTYMRYPVIYDEYNRQVKIQGPSPGSGNVLFPKPTEELIEDYEVKKKDFTDSLIASASEMMAGKDSGSSEISIGQLKTMVIADPTKWGIKYLGVKSKLQTHVYAILKTEYPELEFKTQDIKACIHLIEDDISTGKLKFGDGEVEGEMLPPERRGRGHTSFGEDDVPRVVEAIDEHGITEAAKRLDVSRSTVHNFRDKMRDLDKWPEEGGR